MHTNGEGKDRERKNSRLGQSTLSYYNDTKFFCRSVTTLLKKYVLLLLLESI